MQKGLVGIKRIDRSVKKLMREKFILGLFDQPFVDAPANNPIVGRNDFVKLGTLTQRRSYTLLTSNGTIQPLTAPAKQTKLYIEGFNATYMPARSLTVVATSEEGDLALIRMKSPAYPIPGGFSSLHGGGNVESNSTEKARHAKIYGTVPTIVHITLNRAVAIPEVVAGAAAVLGSYGSGADAFWNVVTGVAKPESKLPFDLPRSEKAVEGALEDVPNDTLDPVFKFGHGLAYE